MAGTILHVRQEVLRMEWEIKDFLSLKPESVDSPQFRFLDDDDASWSLEVNPYGDEDTQDDIGLYLKHDDYSSSPVVLFTLAVKKTDGFLYFETPFTWKFQGKDHYGSPRMLSRSDLLQKKNEFLLEGALTFCCLLQNVPPTEAMDSLSLDLKELLVSSAHSDVTVKLKSKEYRAHRAILAAQCDVFASTLKYGMLEKETGIIKIEDCDSDSFGEFLQHLYTGRADINEGNVYHLFRTADKYLVRELKSHCVAFLMENMSVDNVCDAVTLAHDHDEEDLKNFCKLFFCDNARSILSSSDFDSLIKNHCDAATMILKLYALTLPIKP